MSAIHLESTTFFFSHVRRALGALGLAAAGAAVLIGMMPLVAGGRNDRRPQSEDAHVAKPEPARPPAAVSR